MDTYLLTQAICESAFPLARAAMSLIVSPPVHNITHPAYQIDRAINLIRYLEQIQFSIQRNGESHGFLELLLSLSLFLSLSNSVLF